MGTEYYENTEILSKDEEKLIEKMGPKLHHEDK
jgi:hypothetical protein